MLVIKRWKQYMMQNLNESWSSCINIRQLRLILIDIKRRLLKIDNDKERHCIMTKCESH